MSLRSEVIRILNEILGNSKKISELTSLPSNVQNTDQIEVVRSGVNYKALGSQLPSGGGGGTWGSITGTLSDQTDLQNALDAKAALSSPALTGTPTAPTASNGTNTTQIATTAFVLANAGTSADASETTKGIAELATQTETNTGTDDARIVTPLKLLFKNRKESTKTTGYTVAQTDDQGFLIANSASAIAFDFPSLEAGTIVTIININSGDVTWTNSGGTSFVGGLTSMPGGTLMAVTFRYRSTTVIEVLGGAPASVENFAITGVLSVKAGASAGTIAKVGGSIHTDTTTTGNVGTGEDTLFSYSLPANTLNTNKDSICGFVAGTFAANANNKNVRVKFGGTTLFATGAVAFNTGDWRIDFEIIRTGAATQKAIARFTSDNTSLDESCDYTTPAETLSGAITILVTGEATSNNDVVGEMFSIEFKPTP